MKINGSLWQAGWQAGVCGILQMITFAKIGAHGPWRIQNAFITQKSPTANLNVKHLIMVRRVG